MLYFLFNDVMGIILAEFLHYYKIQMKVENAYPPYSNDIQINTILNELFPWMSAEVQVKHTQFNILLNEICYGKWWFLGWKKRELPKNWYEYIESGEYKVFADKIHVHIDMLIE